MDAVKKPEIPSRKSQGYLDLVTKLREIEKVLAECVIRSSEPDESTINLSDIDESSVNSLDSEEYIVIEMPIDNS